MRRNWSNSVVRENISLGQKTPQRNCHLARSFSCRQIFRPRLLCRSAERSQDLHRPCRCGCHAQEPPPLRDFKLTPDSEKLCVLRVVCALKVRYFNQKSVFSYTPLPLGHQLTADCGRAYPKHHFCTPRFLVIKDSVEGLRHIRMISRLKVPTASLRHVI